MKTLTLQVVVLTGVLLSACSSSPETPAAPAEPKNMETAATQEEAAPLLPEATETGQGENAPEDEFGDSAASEPALAEPVKEASPSNAKVKKSAKNRSEPKTIPGVLEEVSEGDELGGVGAQVGGLAATPQYEKLRLKLNELGYEGVGLEHEPSVILNLLTSVFSDPAAAKRKIKRVYTGGGLEYDARAQAITIGGTTNKAKILTFLKKKVPRR